ncbi:MAG: SWIM zinc finger family protein [Actinomycetaceae bacterium]|nr:SWIM zinc finger family protein [Actinomycetaceae bacterium]
MAAPPTELWYGYAAPSALTVKAGQADLDLATSGGITPDGAAAHPWFFSGFVEHPPAIAAALLVLGKVARTRFYTPPGMVAAIVRAADPVVTASPEGLRFEAFSVCCGVQARLDIDAANLDAERLETGVTNVDLNPPTRQALAALHGMDPLHLSVGAKEMRLRTLDGEVAEEKVELPSRWLRSFAQSQHVAAYMRPALDLARPALIRFMQALPRQSSSLSVSWVTATARGHRLASRPSLGAVCLAGPERLRVLDPLVRMATRLRAWSPPVNAGSAAMASAWVMDIPGGRVHILLSPEKSRGFSGEGATLDQLMGENVESDAEELAALLSFDSRINIEEIARSADMEYGRAEAAMALLADSGQLGFDVVQGAYFHRPLPLLDGVLERHHPRLVKAKELVSSGAIQKVGEGRFRIVSTTTWHEVRISSINEGGAAPEMCTCAWYAKHHLNRGACSHILAVRILQRDEKEKA